jgi:chromosomal replication initiator protein
MNSQLNEIWQLTLEELSKDVNKPSFETWFKLTKPVSLDNNCLVIEVPNDFTKEWFETRFRQQIINALKEVTTDDHRVNFVISTKFQSEEENVDLQAEPARNTYPKNIPPLENNDVRIYSTQS